VDKEKLSKWSSVAEILSSVAVLITLVFLVYEIRQNTKTLEREMQMELVLSYSDVYLNQPILAEIYSKVKAVDGLEPLADAFVDRYELTPAEAVLWARNVSKTLWIIHSQFLQDGPSENLETQLSALMTYPDFRIAFDMNEDSLLTPEFINYVLSIVGEQ
jgi:hypothetical protein